MNLDCFATAKAVMSRRGFVSGLCTSVLAASLLVLDGHAATAPEKIAFVGSGRMGTALGTLLVKAGHEVMFSSRHPEELKSLVEGLGPKARAGTVADAVKFGDIVFLTLPYNGMPDLARDHGKALAAKPLVVDVGNPSMNRDGELGAKIQEKGLGSYLREALPGVKIVRAFNAINWAKLPEYATRTGKSQVAAPILGDDRKAIALAEKLIRQTGFEPVLVGGLDLSAATAPRSVFADDHSAEEVRKMAAELKK
jgi:predicted dinucleotide-binding enzyme